MADTIGTLIDGIANSKSDIADAIENKGVTVPSGTKLAGMASLINQISTMHGPASSVDGNLAAFDGTSGDTLKDSGIAASSIALDSNVVHRTGDEPVTGIKTFDGNGEIRFQTSSQSAYYGSIKETSSDTLEIRDATVNLKGYKAVVGNDNSFIEMDRNILPGGRINEILIRDVAINTAGSDMTSATYVFPTQNKTNGSVYTLATTDDIPAVLSTGGSNKDKYLHTNVSTGALEWSSLSVTDTKNTAGSTNDTSLLYLIGAKTQAANPQTYSRNNTYINANGVLVNTTGFSSQSAGRSDYASINIGTNILNYYSGSGPASFKATSSTHGSWQIGDNSGNIYLQKTGVSGPSSGNAYLLFPNVGTSSAPKTLATTDDIPDDADLVHKGTSSSSVDETIYGNKTFSNQISANSGITGGTTQTAPYARLTYELTPSKLELTNSLTGDSKLTIGGLTLYDKMANTSVKYQLNNITKTITNSTTQTDTVYTYVFPDKSCTLGAAVQIIDLRS